MARQVTHPEKDLATAALLEAVKAWKAGRHTGKRGELAEFFAGNWCQDLCAMADIDYDAMIEKLGIPEALLAPYRAKERAAATLLKAAKAWRAGERRDELARFFSGAECKALCVQAEIEYGFLIRSLLGIPEALPAHRIQQMEAAYL